MALYEIASEAGRRIFMNVLLREDKGDEKRLPTDHGLQRLSILTIWALQLFGGLYTSFI